MEGKLEGVEEVPLVEEVEEEEEEEETEAEAGVPAD